MAVAQDNAVQAIKWNAEGFRIDQRQIGLARVEEQGAFADLDVQAKPMFRDLAAAVDAVLDENGNTDVFTHVAP
jgi:hypothetical protein